jgi:hypothetical protein
MRQRLEEGTTRKTAKQFAALWKTHSSADAGLSSGLGSGSGSETARSEGGDQSLSQRKTKRFDTTVQSVEALKQAVKVLETSESAN